MVFSTIAFLFQFLPIFLLAYYATPQKYRNITLVIGSLVFYAIWQRLVYPAAAAVPADQLWAFLHDQRNTCQTP